MIIIGQLPVIICLVAFWGSFCATGECAVQCVGIPDDIKQWQQCDSVKDCIVTKGDCGRAITFNGKFIKEEAEYALCKPPDTGCGDSPRGQNLSGVKADCVKNKCVIPPTNP